MQSSDSRALYEENLRTKCTHLEFPCWNSIHVKKRKGKTSKACREGSFLKSYSRKIKTTPRKAGRFCNSCGISRPKKEIPWKTRKQKKKTQCSTLFFSHPRSRASSTSKPDISSRSAAESRNVPCISSTTRGTICLINFRMGGGGRCAHDLACHSLTMVDSSQLKYPSVFIRLLT